jgi:hypothetical protein
MWALLYVFAISFVATVLYSVVDRFESEHWHRLGLKFVIVCIAAAAIARHSCLKARDELGHFILGSGSRCGSTAVSKSNGPRPA